nr:hypothetical protein [Streptococcus sanguinis]
MEQLIEKLKEFWEKPSSLSKKYIFQNGVRKPLAARMAGLSVMFLLFSCGLLNF